MELHLGETHFAIYLEKEMDVVSRFQGLVGVRIKWSTKYQEYLLE